MAPSKVCREPWEQIIKHLLIGFANGALRSQLRRWLSINPLHTRKTPIGPVTGRWTALRCGSRVFAGVHLPYAVDHNYLHEPDYAPAAFAMYLCTSCAISSHEQGLPQWNARTWLVRRGFRTRNGDLRGPSCRLGHSPVADGPLRIQLHPVLRKDPTGQFGYCSTFRRTRQGTTTPLKQHLSASRTA